MNSVQSFSEAIMAALFDVWDKFAAFIPTFIGALVVFFVGVALASFLGKITEKFLKSAQVDKGAEKIGIAQRMRIVGFDGSLASLIGALVKWLLVLVFLMAATDVLGLTQITNFLNDIILYLPNLVVAVVILTVAFLVGGFVEGVVGSSTKAAGVVNASFLAKLAKWTIVAFGLIAAMVQLGIVASLANTLFVGLVSALALAFGLAFGLGGKDEAALVLRKIREEIEKR